MNLLKKSNEINDFFSPKIIGEVNDVFVKLVKIKGDRVPWHTHKNEDELFYILKGSLLFEIENQKTFNMQEGDMFIVKRGINHRVSSRNTCTILLIENKTTRHTGSIESEITKTIDNQRE